MSRSPSNVFALAAVAALALQSCGDQPTPTGFARAGTLAASVESGEQGSRHIVLFAAERVPADFTERVAQLGGTLSQSLDSIGVGVVRGLSQTAVATLLADGDIRAVEPDVAFQIAAREEVPGSHRLGVGAADPRVGDGQEPAARHGVRGRYRVGIGARR